MSNFSPRPNLDAYLASLIAEQGTVSGFDPNGDRAQELAKEIEVVRHQIAALTGSVRTADPGPTGLEQTTPIVNVESDAAAAASDVLHDPATGGPDGEHEAIYEAARQVGEARVAQVEESQANAAADARPVSLLTNTTEELATDPRADTGDDGSAAPTRRRTAARSESTASDTPGEKR